MHIIHRLKTLKYQNPLRDPNILLLVHKSIRLTCSFSIRMGMGNRGIQGQEKNGKLCDLISIHYANLS